ncbi:MAG: hypothetical protein RR448_12705 [Niameybacter sp.]|uniref:hypothetical protein n=1 Tax=Niameybacter sp. TaxID=2033640 RepID=UPI002FCC9224
MKRNRSIVVFMISLLILIALLAGYILMNKNQNDVSIGSYNVEQTGQIVQVNREVPSTMEA